MRFGITSNKYQKFLANTCTLQSFQTPLTTQDSSFGIYDIKSSIEINVCQYYFFRNSSQVSNLKEYPIALDKKKNRINPHKYRIKVGHKKKKKKEKTHTNIESK